jgi:hypothetical protein
MKLKTLLNIYFIKCLKSYKLFNIYQKHIRDKNKVNKIRKQDPGLNDHNYPRAAATRWRRNSSNASTKSHTFVKE